MQSLKLETGPLWVLAVFHRRLTALSFSSPPGHRVVPRALVLRRQPVRHPRQAGHHLPTRHPAGPQDPRGGLPLTE